MEDGVPDLPLIESSDDLARLLDEVLLKTPGVDRRSLTGPQLLMATVLAGAIRDLRSPWHRDRQCGRRALAGAWLTGAHPCGCRYEATLSFEDVAEALRQEPDEFRERVLERLRPSSRIVGGVVRSRFVHGA